MDLHKNIEGVLVRGRERYRVRERERERERERVGKRGRECV